MNQLVEFTEEVISYVDENCDDDFWAVIRRIIGEQ